MKPTLFFAAMLTLAPAAHAESWFQFEAGLAASRETALEDGVWQQQGAAINSVKLTTPGVTAGVTGRAWQAGNWSLDWHLDYVYLGTVSASCMCVADTDYDAHRHVVLRPNAPTYSFSGSGHTQGVALTLSPGYSFGDWRVSVEGGPWVFWQTWSERALIDGEAIDASHKTVAQLSYVVGARIEYGNFSLAWHYYAIPDKWNSYPGFVRGANVVSGEYKF